MAEALRHVLEKLFFLPRNARLLAAAALRKWELENEKAPPDELCFWKLTADGGVHAVTLPGSLFAEQPMRQQSNEEDQEQQQQTAAPFGSRSESKKVVSLASFKGRGSKQQQEHREKPETTGRDISRELNGKPKCEQQKQLGAHGLRPAAATTAHRGDVEDDLPTPGDSSTAVQESNPVAPRKEDRFGRKIKVARNYDRQNVNRPRGPPEGTLLALGWGWGGEFRIGTGRDGFETQPRPLHPEFKVGCWTRYRNKVYNSPDSRCLYR